MEWRIWITRWIIFYVRYLRLRDGSYSMSDIQDYVEKKKKNGGKSDNPLIRIYVDEKENRITFRIKAGY